jgi:DNA polymerase III alpha subunit
MGEIIPIFSSYYSIGRSILTLNKPSKEEWPNSVSIFDIVKKHDLKSISIADDSMGGFYQAYKQSRDLKVKLHWGVFLNVINSLKDFQKQTSSQVIVWLKNGDGYADLNRILHFMNTDGYRKDVNAKGEELTYGYPYIDWDTLNQLFTSNLDCSIPFYSGFLKHNLFNFDNFANPIFEKINPTFFINDQGLPFDPVLSNITQQYCKTNNAPCMLTKHIYYYEPFHAKSLLTMRAILNRGSMEKPECPHFSSNQFSFLDEDIKQETNLNEVETSESLITLGERKFNYV